MKKVSLLLILLLVITGCSKKTETSSVNIDYGEKVYKIYKPYKEAVSSYVINDNIVRTDITKIDKILMNLSKEYFDPNTYYYQSGQYLTSDKIKYLLSDEKLNNKQANIDNNNIKHNYISYIYEQDYLDENGNIKGISIMLGLNKYAIVNNDLRELNHNEVLEIGKLKANELVSYIHAIQNMNNVPIVVGLYIQTPTISSDSGSVEYIGINNKNKVEFKQVNYGEYQITSSFVKTNDSVTYNNFNTLVSFMKKEYNNLSISAKCIYQDKELIKLIYEINSSLKSDNEIIAINQSFIDEFSKLYNKDIKLELKIKANKEIESLLIKNGENITVHILEGE